MINKFAYCKECGRQFRYERNPETGYVALYRQVGCNTVDQCERKIWAREGISVGSIDKAIGDKTPKA